MAFRNKEKALPQAGRSALDGSAPTCVEMPDAAGG
jgi:hypothetical protein